MSYHTPWPVLRSLEVVETVRFSDRWQVFGRFLTQVVPVYPSGGGSIEPYLRRSLELLVFVVFVVVVEPVSLRGEPGVDFDIENLIVAGEQRLEDVDCELRDSLLGPVRIRGKYGSLPHCEIAQSNPVAIGM